MCQVWIPIPDLSMIISVTWWSEGVFSRQWATRIEFSEMRSAGQRRRLNSNQLLKIQGCCEAYRHTPFISVGYGHFRTSKRYFLKHGRATKLVPKVLIWRQKCAVRLYNCKIIQRKEGIDSKKDDGCFSDFISKGFQLTQTTARRAYDELGKDRSNQLRKSNIPRSIRKSFLWPSFHWTISHVCTVQACI